MSYQNYHHNAYKAAAYREESKTRQVVMLYEGVLNSVKKAKHAMETGDIEARYNNLTKACEILTGLQLSLDFEHGGEISQLLYDYYAGLDMRLNHLHFTQDMAICDLCIRQLEMMKSAWEDVDKQVETKSTSNQGGNQEEIIRSRLKDIAEGGEGGIEVSSDYPAAAGYASAQSLAAINVSA